MPISNTYTVRVLAEHVSGHVIGLGDLQINDLKSLQQAETDTIAYVKDAHFLEQAKVSKAGCLIVSKDCADHLVDRTLIVVNEPYHAFAQLTHLFNCHPVPIASIDLTAKIASTATIGENVFIGAYSVIGEHVSIGANSIVLPHSVIADEVTIGQETYIESHVTIGFRTVIGERVRIHAHTNIGSEGFGFAPSQGRWHRIAQLGKVVIGNDVRIGAHCCIDRGALDDTIIEEGVIIDNLVQIAHNVTIGAHTAIAAHCGIAGSTQIGRHCILGGACGVAGHLTIADHVHFTGMSMVTKSINESGLYSSGTGVMSNQQWKKAVVGLRQLAQYPLQQALKKIDQRLQHLEKNLSSLSR